MYKVSIIGGSGFVGTNLCRSLLKNGIDFEILDIKESIQFPEKFKHADVREKESLRSALSGDIVVNLAAVHRDDVRNFLDYQKTNIEGAENLATVCTEKMIKKIIFTSSVAVYGFATQKTDENGKINPFNEYGRTKFAAEEIFREWQKQNENSLIIVRPTVIFGEGNRGNVYNLLKQVASGRFVMIGSGKNKKSMAYISNITEFLHTAIKADKKYALYNYVDTPDFTMNELVKLIRFQLTGKEAIGLRLPLFFGIFIGYLADLVSSIFGKNLPISSIRVRKFVASSEFISSKANLEGFKPPYSLKQGLERTLKSEFINPDPSREIFLTE